MAPETCEHKCKALEDQIELLKVQLADLSKDNKRLEDQIASRKHSSNPNCDVKVEEQEHNDDLISILLRCHDYFCCEKEQSSEQLIEFVKGKVFVDLVLPPGSKDSHEVLSIFAKLVTMGMIDVLYRLHLEGISLDGKFSCYDFHWMSNKKVKLRSEVRKKAQLKSKDSVNNDYAALHESIKKIFKAAVVNGTKMPFDFQALLRHLASKDPRSAKMLIRYHMSLLDEIGKKTHFLTMYGRYEQLLEEERRSQNKDDVPKKQEQNEDGIPKSEIVLSYIISAEANWTSDLRRNRFVLKGHSKHLVDTGPKQGSEPGTIKSRKELLAKWRHSLTHLHELAIEYGETQFNDINHVQMLESCAQGVFSQFQEGMHAINELEYPHLMTALKA